MIDTSITDIAFEDELMEERRHRPRERQTCATCAHDGCCVDLHYCGGASWTPAEGDGDEALADAHDPYEDGPDPYDKWLHDSEVWQEQADKRW